MYACSTHLLAASFCAMPTCAWSRLRKIGFGHEKRRSVGERSFVRSSPRQAGRTKKRHFFHWGKERRAQLARLTDLERSKKDHRTSCVCVQQTIIIVLPTCIWVLCVHAVCVLPVTSSLCKVSWRTLCKGPARLRNDLRTLHPIPASGFSVVARPSNWKHLRMRRTRNEESVSRAEMVLVTPPPLAQSRHCGQWGWSYCSHLPT